MATEYVDAGQALPYATLSTSVGKAPPVTKGLTHERILNARDEPHNWLTYYGTYDGQRYSPLDQINKENVGKLTPQWVFQAGSMGLHSGASTYAWEASPIIVDGVMFVSGWDGQLWALDAANGNGAVALQARLPVRRVAVLRQRQPRRRRGRGAGLHDHPERPHHRAGRRDRQEGLGPDLRRRAGRRERDGRAPDRQGHGHRRQLRRRVRLARPHRRVQARDRRARVALLHDPQAGRARLGDLAGRRRGLAARWRELLGHPARTTRT